MVSFPLEICLVHTSVAILLSLDMLNHTKEFSRMDSALFVSSSASLNSIRTDRHESVKLHYFARPLQQNHSQNLLMLEDQFQCSEKKEQEYEEMGRAYFQSVVV